ncbi:hypothetical protein SAMN05192553_102749 [Cyclobacterium xiamenense]|uniref:DUF748 domain-containing protein n=1 Tax=Cyclobacterium xiamenense TaxID=1297121 RepID=A0A1H6WWI5_9BACT|nr:hypothetical protein [Cyclobacterium xiamenense]SEJ17130.1 hypothetical protein SAMN05192553_102749 [Cyclobacterium xiamenense]
MKKTLVLILILVGSIAALLTVLPFLVNQYLNRNAERIVSNMITRTNDFAGHEVSFGDIHLDYDYRGTYLKMDSVDIRPGEDLDPDKKIRFQLTFDEASLTGFRWVDFLFFNSIQLDSAYIENVVLETVTPDLEEMQAGQQPTTSDKGEDYQAIGLNHLRVNKVSFENRDSETDSVRLSLTDLFVFADGFRLDKEDRERPDALFSVESIEGYLANAQVHLNNSLNVVEARDLSFNTRDQRLIVEEISFRNKLRKYAYVNRFEKETNWMELTDARMQLDGMDFQAYFREGTISADTLRLEGLDLDVFRDKRKVEDTSKRPKMIHEILEGLPRKLHLPAIAFSDIRITYEERPETKAPTAGKIFFDQVEGEISGFSTVGETSAQTDTLRVSARGRLMGQGQIDLQADHLINDRKGTFFLKGSVGAMNLPMLNDMIMPATRVALKSGRLNDLFFDIRANDLEGTGQVIARYEDLEIEILDKNFKRNQNAFRRIGAFLANKVVIRTQNPKKSGDLSKGAVYFEREKHKFVFHYWWNLVLSGLKSTITGQTEEEMREK